MIMLNLTQYERWKAEVDRVLVEICGEDSEGIPDFDYYKAYERGSSSEVTAAAAFVDACALFDLVPAGKALRKLREISEREKNDHT